MNFDIVHTPTVQATAAGDEKQLVQDLQEHADAAAREAETRPDVAAAFESQKQAQERLERLRRAERGLHQYARELAAKLASKRAVALDHLIHAFGEGEKADTKSLSELAAWETRNRQVSQAIERLVEHILPAAQLNALREESHAVMTKVKALQQMAQERAEKLLDHLRDAVSEEVMLPVDLSKGVSGALLHQAEEYKHYALQLSESADRLEKTFLLRESAGKGERI